MQSRALWLVFLLCSGIMPAAAATYTYDYNDNCSHIYQDYMSLCMDQGRAALAIEVRANPYNLMATYLADYEDCLTLLLNCNKNDYDRLSGHLRERIELLDKGNPSSPWYRFCKAGIYLHWAIADVRFGEQYKAAINFKRSFALLKENQRLFPAFEYNNVFAGLQEAVVGALPDNYKWLASVFGMKGDIKKGTEVLRNFVYSHTGSQPLHAEAVLYYVYVRFYLLADQDGVWNYLSSPQFPVSDNLLNSFVKVNIALDGHHADAAVQTLSAAASNAGYTHYPIFDYQMGLALLGRLDTACVPYFLRYLRENHSDTYIKDAWQKMAFAWYVNGNLAKANYCIAQIKKQGFARIDADKQAARFAENRVWPLRALLQARLLTDGGYPARALAVLKPLNEATLTNADKPEYYYRFGKAFEETARGADLVQNTKLALSLYRQAMAAGKGRHEQFAARAALQTGKIYEQLDMKTEALSMYHQCLSMPSHDFQNSIDQQAKSGINRLSGE